MKKRNNFIIISLLIILLIVPSALAFSFSDFWNKIFGNSDVTGKAITTECSEGPVLSTGCLCDGVERTSGYCCYQHADESIYPSKLKWNPSYPCTQSCQSLGGTCCGGSVSGNTCGSWAKVVTPDCYPTSVNCCIGKCTGPGFCYGPNCDNPQIYTDSDGGKNYEVKGYVTSTLLTSQGASSIYTDFCSFGYAGRNTLTEYYIQQHPDKGYTTIDQEHHVCNCVDGACVPSTNTSPITCVSDSDGGKNYGIKGTVTLSDGTSQTDFCSGQIYLFEAYCDTNNQAVQESYTCQSSSAGRGDMRCIDGVCINPNATTTTTSSTSTSPTISSSSSSGGGGSSSSGNGGGGSGGGGSSTPAVPATPAISTTSSAIPATPAIPSIQQVNTTNLVCKDSDDGNVDYILGKTCQNDNCVLDTCVSNDYLLEGFCSGDYSSISILECPYGCKNGICLQENTKVFNPDSYSGPIKVPEELIDEEISEIEFVCNGCFQDKKCYPFGYRKSKQYCSEDSTFIDQFSEEETCENNFQCRSNVCVSEECVSSSLIKKLFEFFRSMFS